MKTITQELLDGLKNADDIKAFLDLHEQDFLSQSLIDYLNELMNEKNITVAQVAKNSGIGEYVYKIFNGERNAKRDPQDGHDAKCCQESPVSREGGQIYAHCPKSD